MSKKLLVKNTRYLLIWLPVVLLLCSLMFLVVLEMHTHHAQEKLLLLKQSNVWTAFVSKSGNIERHITAEYDIVESTGLPSIELNEPRDTSVFLYASNKTLPFQVLTSNLQWNNKNYLITTYVSSTEISHLIIKVFITEAVILVLLLIAIILINRKSGKVLWSPFFSTMTKIKEFDITHGEALILPHETGTTEFDQLNTAVTAMVDKVNEAYFHQKQFVENASHEMQTPLAVIRSKLELLINDPNLTEKNASLLSDITDANDRLSQMNRTLLLLAKIENNQFPGTELVDIAEIVTKEIQNFKDHYEKIPQLVAHIDEGIKVTVNANRSLIQILISNIIKNAIVHNQPDGKIIVTIIPNELTIENTGPMLEINAEDLFERFKKGSHESKTTGLGLALVKQISNLYHFTVRYSHADGWHRVHIIFINNHSSGSA
jgi:signal transduction histidine kinase